MKFISYYIALIYRINYSLHALDEGVLQKLMKPNQH
jgi:hypothetical protein